VIIIGVIGAVPAGVAVAVAVAIPWAVPIIIIPRIVEIRITPTVIIRIIRAAIIP
jgi:hypothetical protein